MLDTIAISLAGIGLMLSVIGGLIILISLLINLIRNTGISISEKLLRIISITILIGIIFTISGFILHGVDVVIQSSNK